MSGDTAKRVKDALDRVASKVEKAAATFEAGVEAKSNDTVNKLGRLEDKWHGFLDGMNKELDEMIGGHNGAPLDKPKE